LDLAARQERRKMGEYDSEGFRAKWFGGPDLDPRSNTSPGSDSGWRPSPRIPAGQQSGLPGSGSVFPLEWTDAGGNADVNEPAQQQAYGDGGREPFTSIDLDVDKPPAGGGDAADHVVSPHHPNSNGLPR
jgi:hypothetical protein